jgi:hypothetical protein
LHIVIRYRDSGLDWEAWKATVSTGIVRISRLCVLILVLLLLLLWPNPPVSMLLSTIGVVSTPAAKGLAASNDAHILLFGLLLQLLNSETLMLLLLLILLDEIIGSETLRLLSMGVRPALLVRTYPSHQVFGFARGVPGSLE